MLANISTGQGSQISNIALGAGTAQSNAALQAGANQQQLIGNLAGAYGYYQGNNPAPAPAISTGGNGVSNQQFINSQNAAGSGFTGFGG
jgi:hypothetical protein